MTVSLLPLSTSFVFKDLPPQVDAGPAAPPIDLTASDGTGLELVSITARVVIEDPLAFTELELVFQNPEPRELEGRFRIALPPGASISRFAMRLGSSWQEGEVLERQAARRAYEDFLHRRQDPALLEHEAGNEFSARVFPIEPRARKELIVSYSHELTTAGTPYRLPLLGLPRLGSLDIRALVGRSDGSGLVSSLGGSATRWEVLEVRKQDWKPDIDFEVRPPASGRDGLRHGNLAVVRVAPRLLETPDEVASMLVLIDTSASRALGQATQLELLEGLVRGLAAGAGPQVPLAVAGFDQEVQLAFEGTAGSFGLEAMRHLTDRMALGASDLEQALRWARSREGQTYERLLILTDGVATAGETASEQLVEAARALADVGVKRLDVLAVGGIRDEATLRRLVTAGLPADGTVCDGDLPLPEIAAKLTRATRSGLKLEVPGASWLWPTRLDGVQPGDAALVYVDLPEHKPLKVLVDGQPAKEGEAVLETAERPLLERAWVKARIDKLEDQRARLDSDADLREGLKKQVIELSTKYRVLSPYTALLVLETEADYARFNIDRRALADILTVGPGGLEVLHRTSLSVPPAAIRAPQKAKKAESRRPMSTITAAGARESESAFDDEASPAETTLSGAAPEAFGDVGSAPPEMSAPAASAAYEEEVATPMTPLEASSAPPSPRAAPSPASPSPARFAAMGPPPFGGPARSAASSEPEERPSLLQRMARAVSRILPGAEEGADGGAPSQTPAPSRPVPPSPDTPTEARSIVPEPPPPPPTMPPQPPVQPRTNAWSGPFAEVMDLLQAGKAKAALERAIAWRQSAPGDVLALVALGTAAEALGDSRLAARAYGSLIDLFPSRADLRRYAGQLLERITKNAGLELAVDTYHKAAGQRPDHPASHRLLGMALLKAGRYAEAFEALAVGQARQYPPRFPGVDRILAEDLGLAAAAWVRHDPARRPEILARLQSAGARLEDGPSLRFVLVWETDANDVDFHIHDAKGGHAYYREKVLPSGGELYADITQGYGPECFTIRKPPEQRAYPYKLQAHYFRRGPMGYGMGKLQLIEHDGQGRFGFEERAYVVMEDGAYVDLGVVEKPLPVA